MSLGSNMSGLVLMVTGTISHLSLTLNHIRYSPASRPVWLVFLLLLLLQGQDQTVSVGRLILPRELLEVSSEMIVRTPE